MQKEFVLQHQNLRKIWGKEGMDGVKMGWVEWKVNLSFILFSVCQFSMVHVLNILCMLHISFLSHGRHKHMVPEVLFWIKFGLHVCFEEKRYVVVWQSLSKFNHHAGWFKL